MWGDNQVRAWVTEMCFMLELQNMGGRRQVLARVLDGRVEERIKRAAYGEKASRRDGRRIGYKSAAAS